MRTKKLVIQGRGKKGKEGDESLLRKRSRTSCSRKRKESSERSINEHPCIKRVNNMFNVLYGNCRSVVSKIDELRVLVYELNPDIICINETWTNSQHTNGYLSINGFTIVCRHDRKDTQAGAGGGLLIYVKENLCAPESFEPIYKQFNQCCGVKIALSNGRNLELVLVYRPHNLYDNVTNVVDNNERLCEIIENIPKPFVIVGISTSVT